MANLGLAIGEGLLRGTAQGMLLGQKKKEREEEREEIKELTDLRKRALGYQNTLAQAKIKEIGLKQLLLEIFAPGIMGSLGQGQQPGAQPVAGQGEAAIPQSGESSVTNQIALQQLLNNPLTAMVLGDQMGVDLIGAGRLSEQQRHNLHQEKLSEGRLAQQRRGNDIRERAQTQGYNTVEVMNPDGSKSVKLVPKIGLRGEIQTTPRQTEQPIAEQNLPLWINDKLQTPPVGTTPKQALEGGFKRVTAPQKTTIQSVGSVEEILGQIEGLMEKVFPEDEGALGRIAGGLQRKAGAVSQADPDAAQLDSLVNGTLAPIIRSLGEKGALANEDVARARKLMPELTDSGKVAWRKLNSLKKLFEKVKSNAMGSDTKVDMVFNPATGKLEPVE